MTLIDEFRMLADDLYSVEGHNRYASALSKAADEIERLQSVIAGLRARIEAREKQKQKPVAWRHESRRDSDVVTSAVKHVWGKAVVGALAAYSIHLYLAPGAQPAPSMSDLLESLRCACDYIDRLGGVSQQYRAMLASLESKP